MSNRTKLPGRSRKIPIARKFPAATREKIEIAIEKLIDGLDAIEPDPDLEEDDHGDGDVVDEPHDEVAEGNTEPSLGATHAIDQDVAWAGTRGWNRGDDLEFDGDTAPSADTEPSLGSPELCPPIHWAQGARDDREDDDEREYDPAENGIGDQDGLQEQMVSFHGGGLPFGGIERVDAMAPLTIDLGDTVIIMGGVVVDDLNVDAKA